MKKNKKKERKTEIRPEFGKDVTISKMEFSEKGELKLYDENGEQLIPIRARTGIFYDRKINLKF